MSEDLVSIVMPSYNCGHFIYRAIESIYNQTYPHWELIIVDNYSSDDTLDVINSYSDPRIKWFQNDNHGVVAASRNVGISESRGRWVAFLDTDDWWTTDKLMQSVRALNQGNDLVYHDMFCKGPGKRLVQKKVKTYDIVSPAFQDLLWNGNKIVNSSVVVRRDLLLAVNGLSEDPKLIAAEDYDCWLRIARITEKFFRIRATLGYYWIGKNNLHLKTNRIDYLERLKQLYLLGESQLPPWYKLARAEVHMQYKEIKASLECLNGISYPFHFKFYVKRMYLMLLARMAR